MNVLTLTSLFPNNTKPDSGRFILKRMAAVANIEGYRVEAIAPVPYCPDWAPKKWNTFNGVLPKEKRAGIKTYHPRYPLVPKISMTLHGLLMWLGVRKIVRKLHRIKPFDLIDGHFVFPDGQAALFAGRELGVPVVISARGSDIHQYPNFRTIRPQIQWTLKNADQVIAVCEALKQSMVALGIPNEKIDVIPNGIDGSRFCPVDQIAARKRLELPQDRKMILAIGNLVPVKGHARIVDSLHCVKDAHPETIVYVVGDGPERGRLQAQIKRLGLHHDVILAGQKPNSELKWWYNAADVFCLPSLREGWPNVLMESLACGTPVVATNVFGAPEIVTNENVGILVDQTTEAIAKGLIEALDRKWDIEAIRKHVEGRSWDVVAVEVDAVFRKAKRPGG